MFIKSLRIKIYNFFCIKNYNSNYGSWKGSLNYWNILLWNILFPGRIIHRFKGNNLFKFNTKKYIQSFEKVIKNPKLNKKLEVFYRDGAVVIDSYFSEELVENFKSEYSSEILILKKTNNINNPITVATPIITEILLKFWLDYDLMKFLEYFYQKKFYARNYPKILFHENLNYLTSKDKFLNNKSGTSLLSDNWHVDHANLVNIHILLEDVKEDDLCMEYIPKSHNYLNMTNFYSDEEVIKLERPIKCVGKKGTVYFHYGNTLHRMLPVRDSSRLQFHFEFTSAENILLNCEEISHCLSGNFKLSDLDFDRRFILSGIFPIALNKGYNINNNIFKPSSEKII